MDVLAHIQQEHRQIEQMMNRVAQATDGAKRDAFEDLVRKLAVHETAEEEVVHPLLKQSGLDAVYESVTQEEDSAKKLLSKMDGADVTTPEFDASFEQLRSSVKAHAEHEETSEHPQIAANTPSDKLRSLTSKFELGEKTAPTHPHASAPESRAGNLALGPIFAVVDRVRDAIRESD
jgi:hypothetical protein